ncbi:integrase [Paenibacillus popilliae ATCC 14706]|uniref:Integrase n=1 Tax=Paenibacillus popilliae ATCC 14706 TaxID=1212764 RepID=M9LFL0_PAEPP|nr:integrase [Paenibacillus popilliae ATCC 14706]
MVKNGEYFKMKEKGEKGMSITQIAKELQLLELGPPITGHGLRHTHASLLG